VIVAAKTRVGGAFISNVAKEEGRNERDVKFFSLKYIAKSRIQFTHSRSKQALPRYTPQ
jgi:hypothetical protein